MAEFRTDKEMGAKVAELRKAMGQSQAELAQVLGVDQTTVSRIESGERELDVKELIDLSRHFGIEPSAILRSEPEPVLLRASDKDSAAVRHALEVFDKVISSFWSARALATLR
jgi:transcriptional regulator with XRE-family HTH domain